LRITLLRRDGTRDSFRN